MIIDLILDRKDNRKDKIFNYNAVQFFRNILAYESMLEDNSISIAMDYKEETDVKKALCNYIDNNGYNPNIKKFINSVSWLKNESS